MEMAMAKSSIGIVFEEIRPCGKVGGGRDLVIFDDFRSAKEYAKNNPGVTIKKNPDGGGFIAK